MGDIQNHYDFPAHSQTGNKHSKKQWNTPELPASVLSQNAIHSAVMAMEFEKLIIQSQLHKWVYWTGLFVHHEWFLGNYICSVASEEKCIQYFNGIYYSLS